MNARDEILDWAEQGRIAPGRLRAALEVGGALPSAADWRAFLDRLLLWTGAVFLAAAAIFFIAYNWAELGRFGKLALAELALLAALAFVGWLGLERAAGKAALLAAALVAGALLALIGQIYQTGADTFELFAAWAVAILPWVLVGRFAALWLVWLAIVNLALALYFQVFSGFFGFIFTTERQLWLHFALDTAALAGWEWGSAAGIEWLRTRSAPRILATASGGLITVLALYDVLGERTTAGAGLLGWFTWLAVAHHVYRHRVRDLFVLAGGVLSAIIVVAAFLVRELLRDDAPIAFLFVAVVVIGLSAAGGWWLKRVAGEEGA